jgi:hypothetical protein
MKTRHHQNGISQNDAHKSILRPVGWRGWYITLPEKSKWLYGHARGLKREIKGRGVVPLEFGAALNLNFI